MAIHIHSPHPSHKTKNIATAIHIHSPHPSHKTKNIVAAATRYPRHHSPLTTHIHSITKEIILSAYLHPPPPPCPQIDGSSNQHSPAGVFTSSSQLLLRGDRRVRRLCPPMPAILIRVQRARRVVKDERGHTADHLRLEGSVALVEARL